MRQEYIDELEKLRIQMEEAEKFAEKLPLFDKKILAYKYTGDEEWIKFGEQYKKILLNWGINRGLYQSDSRRTITNYDKGSYTEFLFNIYLNSCSLFDCHCNFGLEEVLKTVDIFFFDKLNTTIYATDLQIEPLLEALNAWYIKARDENIKLRQQENIKKAMEEIKKAEDRLKELNV